MAKSAQGWLEWCSPYGGNNAVANALRPELLQLSFVRTCIRGATAQASIARPLPPAGTSIAAMLREPGEQNIGWDRERRDLPRRRPRSD
jgi:hypothetical protein